MAVQVLDDVWLVAWQACDGSLSRRAGEAAVPGPDGVITIL